MDGTVRRPLSIGFAAVQICGVTAADGAGYRPRQDANHHDDEDDEDDEDGEDDHDGDGDEEHDDHRGASTSEGLVVAGRRRGAACLVRR